MRKRTMPRPLVLAALVAMFLFAMASGAFAYTIATNPMPATATTNQTVNTLFVFTKGAGDTPVLGDGVNSGTWQMIQVVGTPIANVAGVGNWSNSPWQNGNGDAVFESQYSPWVGNNWTHVSPLGIKFLQPGVYTVRVGLVDDAHWSGGPVYIPGSMQTYTLTVSAPVVSTSASSTWSIIVAGVLALGLVAAYSTVHRRRARHEA